MLTATDSHGQHVSCSFSFSFSITGGTGGLAVPAGTTVDAVAPATQQTGQTTTAPNIQSYWFTYNADNRVQVSNKGDGVSWPGFDGHL